MKAAWAASDWWCEGGARVRAPRYGVERVDVVRGRTRYSARVVATKAWRRSHVLPSRCRVQAASSAGSLGACLFLRSSAVGVDGVEEGR
jgi:hypothetical protein